ncbi:hypothetical protein UCREL1_2323 [Eutypa lata UCREL1]|uniref:Uncharacterized protein n=1 Tax=Eutypa lata (strain UCR-EL1) TaxID=1287681 RepID=M7TL41_EUTLA|nr:hypothetical protein UCREL1_2323 [Eutypa lata UCREL1]
MVSPFGDDAINVDNHFIYNARRRAGMERIDVQTLRDVAVQENLNGIFLNLKSNGAEFRQKQARQGRQNFDDAYAAPPPQVRQNFDDADIAFRQARQNFDDADAAFRQARQKFDDAY